MQFYGSPSYSLQIRLYENILKVIMTSLYTYFNWQIFCYVQSLLEFSCQHHFFVMELAKVISLKFLIITENVGVILPPFHKTLTQWYYLKRTIVTPKNCIYLIKYDIISLMVNQQYLMSNLCSSVVKNLRFTIYIFLLIKVKYFSSFYRKIVTFESSER